MENGRIKTAKLAVAFLALLLISSALILLGSSLTIGSSIEATPLSTRQDYGDLLQYEWSGTGSDEGQSGFSAGPAPEKPDVLWKVQTSGSGFISVFNGKAFVLSGATVKAFDAFSGDLEWTATLESSATGNGGTTKIDNTYFFVDCSGPEVHKISDGSFVSHYTVENYGAMAGSGMYFPGSYSSTLKMKYVTSYDPIEKVGLINAVSLADPKNPELAWTYTVSDPSEIAGFGGGKLYVGSTAATVTVLNGTTGDLLYVSPKTGMVQQHGFYYNGNFYHAAASQCMTCWDGDTGEVLWEFDSRVLGTRAFYAYRGAAGFGRVFDSAVPSDPHGWVCCWDAETGELLWKQPAYYNIAYSTLAVADGKVYVSKCDRTAGSVTAGLVMPGYAFSCFDAFTGTEIWSIEGLNVATPSIAYGNLYFVTGGYVYCIGDSTPTEPWSFGFHGNVDQPRVALGQSGPSDLSEPKWVYATNGKITSSPAIVAGKVYIGSEDHNWYCLDAYTGRKIWDFTTGYKIRSSAAVVNGRVFTGADDGNVYALDAETGEQIWKADAGGLFTTYLFPQEFQVRSSPIVVGNRLYVGAMDGKVYCIDVSDGSVKWRYQTDGPIGGSPAYSDGVIFIASIDTYLYALDAATGTLVWKSIPLNLDLYPTPRGQLFNTPTPVVANDQVFVSGGATFSTTIPDVDYSPTTSPKPGSKRLVALNETTGEVIWITIQSGNTGSTWIPVYVDGVLYVSYNMRVAANNATNGDEIWQQWVGYQILSSVAYADDIRGPKVYICSDVGSVSCLDAETGAGISAYQTPANVEGSPSIWEGKLYFGSADRSIYCFDDSPMVDFSISAESNKGTKLWSNETVVISGRLVSNPMEITWDGNSSYVSIASDMHPGLPDATIKVSFTKPDGTDVTLDTTTDKQGYFSLSYSPTDTGEWGWVAYYDGMRTLGIQYNQAYGEWNPFTVNSPAAGGGGDGGNEAQTAFPMEYVYAAIAVIVIVVVVFLAYFLLKRK